MTFPLYSEVTLAHDLPASRLRRGDLLRLVDRHVAPDGERGYSAEVLGAKGQVLAVVAIPETAVEAVRDDAVLGTRARRLASDALKKLAK